MPEYLGVLEYALENAEAITWDTCHKIYVLMDNEQVQQMREYDYDPIVTKYDATPEEMLDLLIEWYNDSCGLRFINSVETNNDDPNEGFHTLVPQGYDRDLGV